jgi:hypothetical protein
MVGLIFLFLNLVSSLFKSKSRLEAENAALRQQLSVLQRKVRGRVQFTNSDRLFFIQLYRWFPAILKAMTIIRPETLVRWHRAGFRRVARQITEAFPWKEAPRYLIRDRDAIYGAAVARRLRAMGIRDKPIAPGSPWQNAFAERLIGSIRRECVDHIVVLGEAHLRRMLQSYARYYNEIRTHRSLNDDAPLTRPVQRSGHIVSHAMVGGLHHQYVRI